MPKNEHTEPTYQLAAARVDILLQEIERIVADTHWQGTGEILLSYAKSGRLQLVPFTQASTPNADPDAYHHNIALVEVLSQEPINAPSLQMLTRKLCNGEWVGEYRILNGASARNEEFTAEALVAVGSDPGAFGIDQN